MLTAEFESLLERFRATKAFALSSPEAPASLEQVRAFEELHNFRLPVHYWHVATTLGTGDIGFTNLYSVHPGRYGISEQRDSAPSIPSHLVPFSDNGCGDFYGFLEQNGVCLPQVYFADHESEYRVSETEFADLYEYLVRYGFNVA
jgi:hypothetical protein